VTPAADQHSPLSVIQDGDRILLDAEAGRLDLMVSREVLDARTQVLPPRPGHGYGRELFAPLRALVGDAESGGSIFNPRSGPGL